MSLKNLKVKTKMMLLIVGLCASMLLIGIVGLINMRLLSVGLGEANDSLHHVAVLSKIQKEFVLLRLNLVYVLSLKDMAKLEEKINNVGKQNQLIKDALTGIEKSELNEKERELLKTFKDGYESYLGEGNKLAEMMKKAVASASSEEHDAAVKYAITTVAPLYTKPAEAIDMIVGVNEKEAKETYQTDMAAYHRAFGMMLGIILVAAVASIVCGIMVSGSVTRPLCKVVDMLRDIAQGEGDLTKRIDISGKDE